MYKYNSTIENAGATVAKKPPVVRLSDTVQKQVTVIINISNMINVSHIYE